MAEIYHRMYLIDLKKDSVKEYSGREETEKNVEWQRNADDTMQRIMKNTAIEAY